MAEDWEQYKYLPTASHVVTKDRYGPPKAYKASHEPSLRKPTLLTWHAHKKHRKQGKPEVKWLEKKTI